MLCSGAFDGLHAGHVRYLIAAHLLRPWLTCTVAVAPDRYIESKGRKAYWTQRERAETVAAVRGVEDVICHDELSVATTIRRLRPELFVKGEDWRGKLPDDVQAACADVGTVIEIVTTPGTHVRETRR